METDKIKEIYKKLGDSQPDVKRMLDQLADTQKLIAERKKKFEKEYSKEVIINDKQALLTVYKCGAFDVQFRDMNECNQAIEKLLK